MVENENILIRLRKIGRLLPRSARHFLFGKLTSLLAPRPDKQVLARSPIWLCAPFGSSIGIGWGARANARILERTGFDVRCCDLSSILFAKDLLDKMMPIKAERPDPGPGLLLVHANPVHIPYVFMHLRSSSIVKKYVISYSVWELPRIPSDWQRNLRFVHGVWCPSSFAADAFRAATDKPVHVVPHSVDPPARITPDRPKFGIAPDAFAVLTAVHLGSGLTRKNPLAAIGAFRLAFGDSEKAVLLVKVSQGTTYPDRLRAIEHAAQGASNVRLMHDTLSDTDYWRLLQSVDAVFSMHRSEGFGLVPAQAMSIGKVAVATGWSGNMDYMNSKNSLPINYSLVPVSDPEGNYRNDGQLWAEPDIEHAATLLRRVGNDKAMRRRLGSAAARTMGLTHSHDAVARVISERLKDLGIEPRSDRRQR
jgi:glycosyltransferase involved in cell wall biosynthesis